MKPKEMASAEHPGESAARGDPVVSPDELLKLSPRQVVLDIVLAWAETVGKRGTAKVVTTETPDGVRISSLVMTVENHISHPLMMGVVVEFDGEPRDGDQPRFVLRKLGPTVWKLSPSILDDRLHAYVTLVGVPEPPPWEVS